MANVLGPCIRTYVTSSLLLLLLYRTPREDHGKKIYPRTKGTRRVIFQIRVDSPQLSIPYLIFPFNCKHLCHGRFREEPAELLCCRWGKSVWTLPGAPALPRQGLGILLPHAMKFPWPLGRVCTVGTPLCLNYVDDNLDSYALSHIVQNGIV